MSDTETPIFNPKTVPLDRRRHEWVELDGGRVCVRELTAADSLFVLEHSQRPAGGPGGLTLSAGSVQLWQVVVSCYDGPGPDAKRIFEPTDLPVIQRLRNRDWRRLADAIERVNGLSDSEVSALQDFTAAPPDAPPAT